MRGLGVASSAEQQHRLYEMYHVSPIPSDFHRRSPREPKASWAFLVMHQIYPNEIIHAGIKWPGAECRRTINVLIRSSFVSSVCHYKPLCTQPIPSTPSKSTIGIRETNKKWQPPRRATLSSLGPSGSLPSPKTKYP